MWTRTSTFTSPSPSTRGVFGSRTARSPPTGGYRHLIDWAQDARTDRSVRDRGHRQLRRRAHERGATPRAPCRRGQPRGPSHPTGQRQVRHHRRRGRGPLRARRPVNGIPKTADGHAEMIRQMKVARDTAVKARTTAIITLKKIVVNAPADLREDPTLGDKAMIDRLRSPAPDHRHPTAAARSTPCGLGAPLAVRLNDEVIGHDLDPRRPHPRPRSHPARSPRHRRQTPPRRSSSSSVTTPSASGPRPRSRSSAGPPPSRRPQA